MKTPKEYVQELKKLSLEMRMVGMSQEEKKKLNENSFKDTFGNMGDFGDILKGF